MNGSVSQGKSRGSPKGAKRQQCRGLDLPMTSHCLFHLGNSRTPEKGLCVKGRNIEPSFKSTDYLVCYHYPVLHVDNSASKVRSGCSSGNCGSPSWVLFPLIRDDPKLRICNIHSLLFKYGVFTVFTDFRLCVKLCQSVAGRVWPRLEGSVLLTRNC